jgi:LPPG:FO 2-phospho-L-lactate transferase
LITVLCGGVGGSRFIRALASVLAPERITAIVNTADDDWFHGLYVSPDPDIVTYALAGEVDEERGWGLSGDTFRWLGSLERFGHETWFQIGDRDLATHLHRTRLLRDGWPLSAVAADIARAFGVTTNVLPMSDDSVGTVVETDAGDLAFQEYLVKRHAADSVRGVRFEGAGVARPAPGVVDAIAGAEALLIAPSNPVGSIGPMLAIPGIIEAIRRVRVSRTVVSPIIAGSSLQPPAGEMLTGLGYRVDAVGVAQFYLVQGVIDALVLDETEEPLAADVTTLGVRSVVAKTLMVDDASRRSVAATVLEVAGVRI